MLERRVRHRPHGPSTDRAGDDSEPSRRSRTESSPESSGELRERHALDADAGCFEHVLEYDDVLVVLDRDLEAVSSK